MYNLLQAFLVHITKGSLQIMRRYLPFILCISNRYLYQTEHFFFGFILLPSGHLYAAAKSLEFERGPSTLQVESNYLRSVFKGSYYSRYPLPANYIQGVLLPPWNMNDTSRRWLLDVKESYDMKVGLASIVKLCLQKTHLMGPGLWTDVLTLYKASSVLIIPHHI